MIIISIIKEVKQRTYIKFYINIISRFAKFQCRYPLQNGSLVFELKLKYIIDLLFIYVTPHPCNKVNGTEVKTA